MCRWRMDHLYTGMVPTGVKNSPTTPEGSGLEIDKMNKELAKFHFDSYIGELLNRLPADERKGLRHVVADSYEKAPKTGLKVLPKISNSLMAMIHIHATGLT